MLMRFRREHDIRQSRLKESAHYLAAPGEYSKSPKSEFYLQATVIKFYMLYNISLECLLGHRMQRGSPESEAIRHSNYHSEVEGLKLKVEFKVIQNAI